MNEEMEDVLLQEGCGRREGVLVGKGDARNLLALEIYIADLP